MKAIATTLKDETYTKLERVKKLWKAHTSEEALKHLVEDYFNIIETYFDADLTGDDMGDVAEKVDLEGFVDIDDIEDMPEAEYFDPFEKALKHEDLVCFEEIADGEKFKFYTPYELREPNTYYDSVYIKTWDGTGVDVEDGYITKPIDANRFVVRVKEDKND